MAGSVPLGAGMPDLIVAAYQPLVAGLAGSGAVDANILAYLRGVGRARLDTIATRLRLSRSTADRRIRNLLDADALTIHAGSIALTPTCRDILSEVTAIEVKVNDWQRAIGQARRNRIFAHRSFIAVPDTVAVRALQAQTMRQSGIGVIAINARGDAEIVKQATCRQPTVWAYYYKLAALVGQGLRRVQ